MLKVFSLIVAVIACIAAVLSVPEVRNILGFEFSPAYEAVRRMDEERAKIRGTARGVVGTPKYTISLNNPCKVEISVAMQFRALDGLWERAGWWNVDRKSVV